MARVFDDPAAVPDDQLPPSTITKLKIPEVVPPSPEAIMKPDGFKVAVPVDEYGSVRPTDMDQTLRIAHWVWSSHLAPVKSREEAWLILQRGADLHFKGMSAFDFIYVVKSRAKISPAGAKAVALASGLVEDFKAGIVGEVDARCAVVEIKRKGIPTPIVVKFSVEDAKRAKLWGKVGASGEPSAWVTYPERMLLARATGHAWSDAFPDLLGGMPVREMFDRDDEEDARMAPPQEPDKLLAEVVEG